KPNILKLNSIRKAIEHLRTGIRFRIQRQNFENPMGSAESLLERIIDSAHAPQRIVELNERDDERDENTRGHRTRSCIKQKSGNREDSQHFHQRRRQGMSHFLPQVEIEHTLGYLAKTACLWFLHSERLDDAISCHCFVEDVRHLRHLLLIVLAQQSKFLSKPNRRIKDEWNEHQRHRRQFPVDRENCDQHKNQNCDLFQKLRRGLGSCRLDTFSIRRNSGDQFTSRIAMKKTKRL